MISRIRGWAKARRARITARDERFASVDQEIGTIIEALGR